MFKGFSDTFPQLTLAKSVATSHYQYSPTGGQAREARV